MLFVGLQAYIEIDNCQSLNIVRNTQEIPGVKERLAMFASKNPKGLTWN